MGEDTRDRLVFTAIQLFAEKGYESTSVADILKAAGANSGSLYHFFPTKQDLLLEALRRYRDGIGPMLLAPAWEGVSDPIERVFALLAAYRRMLVATECTYGCPIGSLALELHEPDPPVRELLAVNFDGWVDAVERCYVEAAARLPDALPRWTPFLLFFRNRPELPYALGQTRDRVARGTFSSPTMGWVPCCRYGQMKMPN